MHYTPCPPPPPPPPPSYGMSYLKAGSTPVFHGLSWSSALVLNHDRTGNDSRHNDNSIIQDGKALQQSIDIHLMKVSRWAEPFLGSGVTDDR